MEEYLEHSELVEKGSKWLVCNGDTTLKHSKLVEKGSKWLVCKGNITKTLGWQLGHRAASGIPKLFFIYNHMFFILI